MQGQNGFKNISSQYKLYNGYYLPAVAFQAQLTYGFIFKYRH